VNLINSPFLGGGFSFCNGELGNRYVLWNSPSNWHTVSIVYKASWKNCLANEWTNSCLVSVLLVGF